MEFINEITSIRHPLVSAAILALLLGIALVFCWSPVRSLISHWYLNRLFHRLGSKSITNAYIPDGLGDVIYIERLILQPDNLLLITVKPFRGNIFAAEQIDQWTQVFGHHSYKFPNPLHQQEVDLQALQAVIPKIPIKRLVVFAKGCSFPKGKPDDVCDFADLKRRVQEQDMHAGGSKAVQPALDNAWQNLLTQQEPALSVKQPILYHPDDRKRLFFGSLSGLAAIAYTLWYLGLFA